MLRNSSPKPFFGISPRSLPHQKFTDADDQRLRKVVAEIGTASWQDVANKMGNFNKRQCKERWEKYLSPDINSSQFTPEEDKLLLEKQKSMGSKWVAMMPFFDRRTDAALKNRFQVLQRMMNKAEKKKEKQIMYHIAITESPAENSQPPAPAFGSFMKEVPQTQVICPITSPKFTKSYNMHLDYLVEVDSNCLQENFEVFNEYVCF